MDILRKYVLMLLFLDLANALKTKKRNQTTPIENDNTEFIEDYVEPKLNKSNEVLKAQPMKENSKLKNIETSKEKHKTVSKNSEVKAMKAIKLPIDLLLKHPTISGKSNMRSKIRRNVTHAKKPAQNLKPKIDFIEDVIEAVDESIAEFYNAIKAIKETNKTLQNDDIKVVDDFVNLNKSDELEATDVDDRTIPDSGNIKSNTSKFQPDTINQQQPHRIITNNILRLNSTIVIHNTTYQALQLPMYPQHIHWPYRSWYTGYPYYYKYPYTRCNSRCYNHQYATPYSAPNIVWKTWNNMDLSMRHPNEYCEMDTKTPEYDVYQVQDQNINNL